MVLGKGMKDEAVAMLRQCLDDVVKCRICGQKLVEGQDLFQFFGDPTPASLQGWSHLRCHQDTFSIRKHRGDPLGVRPDEDFEN